MSRSLSVPPAGEGFFAGTLRRLRWTFGWVKISDLVHKTDSDLMTLAEDAVRRNKNRVAGIVLSAFSQRTTMDPRILQRYGDVSRALGSHDAAIFSYLQAAELHLGAGMSQKACALLLQLVRFYPDHIDARLSLGRVLESLTRNKEAAANYAIVARIFEAHGQIDAAQPLMMKIAELWPQARADYQPGRTNPPPPAATAKVVVGVPAAVPVDQDAVPIELDLDGLISSFALEAQQPEVVVPPPRANPIHNANTARFAAVYTPSLLEAAGAPTPADGNDPWDRPHIGATNDDATSSYQAIDTGDATMMDMQAIDVSRPDESFTADATILDLRAIVDPRSPSGDPRAQRSRIIDRTEPDDSTQPERAVPMPDSSIASPVVPSQPPARKLSALKRPSYRPG